ncbi:BQ2448_5132 [Microbotryum intermedium]|uniref:BQ2448_5132 protein n=1 Tax=Microbotryum intermedium TaxID=269621 RepID=A0A238F674_9BASI|nr:BQ2448_5132 [Microbotryum intermedium]
MLDSSSRLSGSPGSPDSSGSPLDSLPQTLDSALPGQESSSDDQNSEPNINGDSEPQRRSSLGESDDALRQYRVGLHHYTRAQFTDFKKELETRSSSSRSSPVGGRKSPK